jgi:hypothetical protein
MYIHGREITRTAMVFYKEENTMKPLYCFVSPLLMFLAFSAYANDPLPRAGPDSVGLSPD